MKMKKLCAFALAFLMTFSLCSCWEEEESIDFWDDNALTEEEPTNTAAEDITAFTLPYLSNQSLDPITCSDGVQQTVGALLYEGLFEVDNTFSFQKVLCGDYNYDAEKFIYSFTLRSGVTFYDGSSLTLADVLATYRRAAESDRYKARFSSVSSMRIVDNALQISLAKGNSAFPALLDIPIVKSGTEKDEVPAGTGPYLFVTESGEACLLKNSDWWKGTRLPLERIELCGIRDSETAAYLFSSHGISMLVSNLTGTDATVFSSDGDETDSSGTMLLFLGFNTQQAPFNNASVRATLSACLDRTQIVSALLAGHAICTSLPISPQAAICPDEPKAGDFSAYETALGEAGISADAPRNMTILVNEENSFKVSIAEYICRQLSCEALTLDVKKVNWNDYIYALYTRDYDLYLGDIKLTADWDISSLIASYGTLNYMGFYDQTTDNLLAAFLANENETTAKALCRRFTEMSPIAPLAFRSTTVMTTSGLVEGLSPTAANPFYNFSNWQFRFTK